MPTLVIGHALVPRSLSQDTQGIMSILIVDRTIMDEPYQPRKHWSGKAGWGLAHDTIISGLSRGRAR
jgi:hypothetical protein